MVRESPDMIVIRISSHPLSGWYQLAFSEFINYSPLFKIQPNFYYH
jgi:hypothetical protein